jgi:hypothetical protein
MKKICQNCGHENAEKDKFCRKCGKELTDAKIEPATQDVGEYKAPVAQPQHVKKKQPSVPGTSNKMALGIGIVAIILSIAAISSALLISPAEILGASSVGTNELASGSVTGGKVADGTLTDADISNTGISKIANNAITSAHILDGAITLLDLDSNLADLISGAANITNESITSNKIKNGTIATNDIANNAITSAKIATDAVTSIEIAENAVESSEIAANAVGSSEIASDAVGFNEMAIKIRYGRTSAYNGSSISHNLGSTPTSVVVTPEYTPSYGSGNATIHANIISVSQTSFSVALWVEYEGNPGSLTPVMSGSPVWIYWIAID